MNTNEVLNKLKAEIERLQRAAAITMEELQMDKPSERMRGELDAYDDILYFIDSLQQEQQDMGLEKEIDDYLYPIENWQIEDEPFTLLAECARHFYELGGRLCSK